MNRGRGKRGDRRLPGRCHRDAQSPTKLWAGCGRGRSAAASLVREPSAELQEDLSPEKRIRGLRHGLQVLDDCVSILFDALADLVERHVDVRVDGYSRLIGVEDQRRIGADCRRELEVAHGPGIAMTEVAVL